MGNVVFVPTKARDEAVSGRIKHRQEIAQTEIMEDMVIWQRTEVLSHDARRHGRQLVCDSTMNCLYTLGVRSTRELSISKSYGTRISWRREASP